MKLRVKYMIRKRLGVSEFESSGRVYKRNSRQSSEEASALQALRLIYAKARLR